MGYPLNTIADFYNRVLVESDQGQTALEYLYSRGFTDSTINTYNVGFCPPIKIEYIKRKYLTYTELSTLIEYNHLFEGPGSRISDRFVDRITFPVCKPNGHVLGFAARTIKNELPKYLNSSESTVYKKARALYGLNVAKEFIYHEDRAIICEGYTDAMAFYQSGTKIAVACGGTHTTESQLAQIARFTRNIYLAFDSDSAGDSVTENTYSLAKNMGLRVGRIEIPAGKDPADVLLNK